jgi:hypothetical protein
VVLTEGRTAAIIIGMKWMKISLLTIVTKMIAAAAPFSVTFGQTGADRKFARQVHEN